MIAVVDASIVFPLLVNEDKSLAARTVFSQCKAVIFLDFLLVEIANGLASSLRRSRFDLEFAVDAMAMCRKLASNPIAAAQYLEAAFTLALAINHPVYDCLYAVAAKDNNATLLTCDAKFAAKLDRAIYQVTLV